MEKINFAIFVSGSGTNCENLIRYFTSSESYHCALVVSNKPDALALTKAERLGVPTAITPKPELNDKEVMMPLLQQHGIQFIVLAGFLPLIPNFLIESYPRRIINIHPALLPKFGGKGMWGHHVHEAVKAAGETETGMTVHYVTPVCDSGEQRKSTNWKCSISQRLSSKYSTKRSLNLSLSSLECLNHTIAPCVELLILLLKFRMGKDIIDTSADTLFKAYCSLIARNGTLQFRAVADCIKLGVA